jgi:sporulation integral membrane protein YlbJ
MPQMRRRKLPYAEILGATLTLAACLLLLWDPENAIAGGLQGLRIFGEIVLPSLLPFFVVSEVLIGLGLVHFLGALVEPLMRPLFNVPGTGSFVWSMGLAAGYPMDAVITAKLRLSGNCTQIEGERLLAFTNTADPLFLLGAVAVGMFGIPALGFHLALAHYLSAIAGRSAACS